MAEALGIVAAVVQLLDASVKVIDYVSAVKHAHDEANKFRDEVSSVVVLLSRLQIRLLDSNTDKLWMQEVSSSLRKLIDQVRNELQSITDKLVPHGSSAAKLFGKLQWPFKKGGINGALSRVARLNTLLQIALQENQSVLAEAVKNDTSVIRDGVRNITAKTTKIVDYAEQQRHDQIIDFLAPYQFGAKYSGILSMRRLGTGKWFLHDVVFQTWLSEVGSTIWCPGIPGAGKTTIMATVIEHLTTRFASDSDPVVIYCFCDYLRKDQDPLSIVSSLWRQLVSKRVLSAHEYADLRNSYLDHGRPPTLDEMSALFREEISRYPQVYLLIDALDEISASYRETLINSLIALESNTNFFFTSRVLQDTVDRFHKLQKLEISADPTDLHEYISGRISVERRLAQHVSKDKKLALDIETEIINKCEGMFLLAKLHMDSLATKATSKAVRRALLSLPKGENALKDTYEGALRRIEGQNPDDRQLAERAILWIHYGSRPLTMVELRHALSVEPGDEEVGDDLVEEALILQICAGLVTVDNSSSTVRFVHYTTQEYFDVNLPVASRFAHDYLAKTSISFLCLDIFDVDPQSQSTSQVNKTMEQLSFLEYAACQWGNHARQALQPAGSKIKPSHQTDQSQWSLQECLENDTDVSELKDLILDFTSCANQVTYALRVYLQINLHHSVDVSGRMQASKEQQLNAFAAFGLDEFITECLNNNVNNLGTSNDNALGNALHWAAQGDHESTIGLLLSRGNVSDQLQSRGFRKYDPFQLASLYGRINAVSLLLKYGADAASPGTRPGYYPLQLASYGGFPEVVKILLDTEAGRKTIFFPGHRGETALHYAVHGRNAETMGLLLRAVENSSFSIEKKLSLLTDSTGRNPLHASANTGLTNMVIAILNSWLGPELASRQGPRAVSMRCRGFGSQMEGPEYFIGPLLPFQEAAIAGHEDAVVAFLKWDNEILPHGDPISIERTTIEATVRGHTGVLNLLLDRVPSVSFEDDWGVSLLHYAAASGSVEMTRSILGRDPNGELLECRDHEGNTPFMRAACLGNVEVCMFLLEQGSDIHMVNEEDGDTALHLAARQDLAAVVEMLICRGGRADVKNEQGQTPLAVAMGNKSFEAALILLTAGAQATEIPSEPQSEGEEAFDTRAENFRARIAVLATRQRKYCPATPRDQSEAYFYLKMSFSRTPPSRVVAQILDDAEYWLLSKTERSDRIFVDESLGDTITYLRSLPVIGCLQQPVRKIIFRISSHDQGWSSDESSHGTYDNSWSWFAAARETKSSSVTGGNVIDLTLGPTILCNVNASPEVRRHEVCWPTTDSAVDIFGDPKEFHWYHNRDEAEVELWVQSLRPGDRICLVPQAMFVGWQNYVIRADIQVYSSFIRRS